MLAVLAMPSAFRATAVTVLFPSLSVTSAVNLPSLMVAGIPWTSTDTAGPVTVPETGIALESEISAVPK